jgi:hypothetical protein
MYRFAAMQNYKFYLNKNVTIHEDWKFGTKIKWRLKTNILKSKINQKKN